MPHISLHTRLHRLLEISVDEITIYPLKILFEVRSYLRSEKSLSVFRIGSQGGSREVVAIKCVDKGSLSKSAVDNLVTEIKLLNVLKHKHIVEMRDFFWDEGFVTWDYHVIISRYVNRVSESK